MAHDVENNTTQIGPFPWSSSRYIGSAVCSFETRANYYTNQLSKGYRYTGRCASQHTELDAYGWRPPTPYWGYDFSTVGISPIKHGWEGYQNYSLYYTMGNDCPIAAYRSVPVGINLSTYRPSFSDLEAQAITDALADLGSATAELGVELKEARKTAEFVGNTLSTLVKAVRMVKTGRIPPEWKHAWRRWKKGPTSALTPAANMWMEYRYAWMPMILGVYDVCDLLDQRRARPVLVTVRKRAEDSVTSVVAESYVPHGGYYVLRCNRTSSSEEVKSVYVVLTFEPKNFLYLALNDVGLLNPASVVWETIPFSWMADWVVNFGSYLNAQAAVRLWSLKGGTATHRHEWHDTVQVTEFVNTAGMSWCVKPSGGTAKAGGHSFNRRVLGSDDMSPTLAFQPDIGWKRCLDLGALLATDLKGLNRSSGLRL